MPRPKGLPKTGGRQVGSLNKATLLKEERRAIFDEQISQRWLEVIKNLPPTYIADQFMDKAKDKREYTVEVNDPELDMITEELNALFKGKSKPSDGKKPSTLGDKAQDKK